ncbi:hypothetical protein IP91_00632 [Pseudoduganella lurida]|uniref:Uncharacterized protein n=1 Tax=Pseudoduganella lurida TaxID=1036180 RepID=A0A562RKJ1_9BURK|nr:hypothetical protein [Pseudoduganella lurida]TWI69562.1 hypothetical protein IP91_00632 [Pseudoduganella lurida]
MPIYVQHEVLGRIPDVFNAEAIWQAPGLALFARRPLLRDLLERCPREQRGRAATRCFSHITLRLPQEDVDDDYHLTRGNRARELKQTLAALHQKDFGDLLGSDQVRYHVTGGDDLQPGEIEVRFGHAVYLPGADEKVLFNVSASTDGRDWRALNPVYPNQRLAVLDEASTPGWPFGGGATLLLINEGPDAPPVLQVRPKDALDCRRDERQDCWIVTPRQDPQGKRLLLKAVRSGAPVVPAAAARPAVWQPRPAVPAGDEPTALPVAAQRRPAFRPGESDATFAPGSRQCITLAALALPRLSRYRSTGATSLSVPFDRALAVAASGEAAVTLVAGADDALHAVTAAGCERIEAPATFTPTGQRGIRLLPAPGAMAERYCALVMLPVPVAAPVTQGTFGRGSSALAALRVLDTPRLLGGDEGALQASPDRIGLSRSAFAFAAGVRGLQITRQSATQALYHLDAELRFVGPIEGDAPFTLPPGHHVVAGHYVLRCDA